MRASLTAAACAVVCAASPIAVPGVARADAFSPVSIGVHAGTFGYGITLERPLLFDLTARIETGTMTQSQVAAFGGQSFAEGDHYDNVLAALDWRPSGSRFRVSAGLLFGSDHVDYVADPRFGTYLIAGHAYPVATTGAVAARVSYDHPSIYIGTGTAGAIIPGLSISANVGVVLRNGTAAIAAGGPGAANPALQADLTALRAQFPTHSISPDISIGILWRP